MWKPPLVPVYDFTRDRAVTELRERLSLRSEAERARELEKANESPVTKLLELTKYIPIPLGGSENRVDTFFQQNYMRADLNPRASDPLDLERLSRPARN